MRATAVGDCCAKHQNHQSSDVMTVGQAKLFTLIVISVNGFHSFCSRSIALNKTLKHS